MSLKQSTVTLRSRDSVRVDLRGSASDVFLLSPGNFHKFKMGRRHEYYGGHYKTSPVIINAPCSGTWHVIIAPPPGRSVRASVSVIKG